MQKNISVIVVANTNSDSLEKVIWSYNTQTFRNFEVIVVSQNLSNSILKTIEAVEKEVFYSIRYVSLTGEKTESNYIKSALNSIASNYILLTNANCLPRPDFIEQHIKNRIEGVFLNGTSFEISKKVTKNITKELIYSSQCFEANGLRKLGLKLGFKRFFITSNCLINTFLDAITKNCQKSNEDNLSFWKSDFNKVIDLDTGLISSFKNIGLNSKNVKFRAILLKLTS